MKKTMYVLSVLLIVSVSFAAIDRFWTNGSGDRDYARGSNWHDLYDGYVFTSNDRPYVDMSGDDAPILNSTVSCQSLFLGSSSGATGELYITGGESTFVSCVFGFVTNSNGYMYVSGGSTRFNGFFTVPIGGYGYFELSDGSMSVNRSQLAQNAGTIGEWVISGGEFSSDTYLVVALNGEADIDISGGSVSLGSYLNVGSNNQGTITMTSGSFNVGTDVQLGVTQTGLGILNLSGDAVFNAVSGDTKVGSVGVGEFNLNGGAANLYNLQIGAVDDPNSQGYATVTGGSLNVDGLLEIGAGGLAVFAVDGYAGNVKTTQLAIGSLGTADFNLNGSAGVGSGIRALGNIEIDDEDEVIIDGTALLKEGAAVDASFANGTDVAGDFVVIASSERLSYLPAEQTDVSLASTLPAGDATDFLTADAQTAGWNAAIYDAGSGSAFVLTSPVSATKTAWSSAGSSDIAVVDGDSVTLSSAKTANGAIIGDTATASLEAAAGGSGSFVNFTVAEAVESTGTVNVSGGSIAAASVAYIGKQGDAALNVSSGSFNAGNVIAATGVDASADIKVSGDATFNVSGLLGLTEGSEFTVSGHQTNVSAGDLTLDSGANITFETDETQGVGDGLVVMGNAVLKGTITTVALGERVDSTYTVLRCAGEIIVDNKNLIKTSFVSYDIVENGDFQELQITYFTPANCKAVIDGGFGLAADANGDCYVNIEDFAVMAMQWLTCNDPEDPECNLF